MSPTTPGGRGRGGAGARRIVRRQGPGADRQARQGRGNPPRRFAGGGPRGRGGHSRHDHRRSPDRAPADRGTGSDRRRTLCRGAERRGEPRAGRAVLGHGRHGGRGNGRGRPRSDAPDRRGHRRRPDRRKSCRCPGRPRSARPGPMRSRQLLAGLYDCYRAAGCGATGNQPAGADRRRPAAVPRLQIYTGRRVVRPAGGGCQNRFAGAHDGARGRSPMPTA